MEKIYQIKVKDMYVAQPHVELVKKADTSRKIMGFFNNNKEEKDEYRLVDCLYSPKPISINFDDNLLNFLMGKLLTEFGEDQVELYELAPMKLYPVVEPEVTVVDEETISPT